MADSLMRLLRLADGDLDVEPRRQSNRAGAPRNDGNGNQRYTGYAGPSTNSGTYSGNGNQRYAGPSTNSGTYSGNGNQRYAGHAGPNNNSGAYSGNGNSHHTNNNYGSGPAINNSGNFTGHGKGGFFDGNFDASARNYRF